MFCFTSLYFCCALLSHYLTSLYFCCAALSHYLSVFLLCSTVALPYLSLFIFIDTYNCSATETNRETEFSTRIKKKVDQAYPNLADQDSHEWYDENDEDWIPMHDHVDNSLHASKIVNVPLQIVSPITHIIWMWQCDNFRANMDFNFQRPCHWDDGMAVRKFNHCLYMKFHNIFDWHDFAWLKNDVMLYPHLIVDDHTHHAPMAICYYYIVEIEYDIPAEIKRLVRNKEFNKLDKYDWFPACLVHYKKLTQRGDQWVLDSVVHVTEIDEDTNWTVCDHNDFEGKVVQQTDINQFTTITLDKPQLQHPDVAANKPFFF